MVSAQAKSLPPGTGEGDVPSNVLIMLDSSGSMSWCMPGGDYMCCLLYTSPSPRDQRGSRMPSSA